MIAVMMHLAVHLSAQWHMSFGRYGWWAYTIKPYEQLGYGFIRHHYVWSWEVR